VTELSVLKMESKVPIPVNKNVTASLHKIEFKVPVLLQRKVTAVKQTSESDPEKKKVLTFAGQRTARQQERIEQYLFLGYEDVKLKQEKSVRRKSFKVCMDEKHGFFVQNKLPLVILGSGCMCAVKVTKKVKP